MEMLEKGFRQPASGRQAAERGVQRGGAPLAGVWGVSPRYNFHPLLTRKGAGSRSKRVFGNLLADDRLSAFSVSWGIEVIRQRGSHLRMRKSSPSGARHITVPAHRTVALGTLNNILNRVSLWNNLPKEDLIRRLREL